MAINLFNLNSEGALETLITLELQNNNYTGKDIQVKENQVILVKGTRLENSRPLENYKVGDEVYVLSEEQASEFYTVFFTEAKVFKVAKILAAKHVPLTMLSDSYVYMNPDQKSIYKSLGCEKLVIIKKKELDSTFSGHK